MFTWLPLELPVVPDHLIDKAKQLAKEYSDTDNSNIDVGNGYRHRTLTTDLGETVISRCQIAHNMGVEWENWVKETLGIDQWLETGVRINNDNGSEYHGPHTDPPTYRFKLYFMVDPGSEDAKTCFYYEPGHLLERDSGTVVCDYKNVVKFEETVIPCNKWILLNTNILHGVTGLKGQRINLVISLLPDHPFIKRYLSH